MTALIVAANTFDGLIANINFDDAVESYYIVLDKNKPFEQQWTDFKFACSERFIKPHIVFITPLIESPQYVDDFLYAYGMMVSRSCSVITYG